MANITRAVILSRTPNFTCKIILMKQLFLMIAFFSLTITIYSQSLFTYGTNAVSKQEFLRAYNKNKSATENKEQALRVS